MSSTAVNWAKDQQVVADSLGPKLILLLLADRADEEHSCYPGQKLLAEEAGCSDRSVRRFIETLEDQGFLHREARKRKEGRGRTSDRYFLHVDQPDNLSTWSDDQPDTADRTNRTPRVDQPDTVVQSIEPSVEPKEKESLSPNGDDAPSEEIKELCELLAALVKDDVGNEPEITKTWYRDMRLLLERGPRGYKKTEIEAHKVRNLLEFVYEHRNADPKFSWAAQIRAPSGLRRNWVNARDWAIGYRKALEREASGVDDDDAWMIRSVRDQAQ